MWMMTQLLVPGVQHEGGPDDGAESTSTELAQSRARAIEQQRVDDRRCESCERAQLRREREHHVEVRLIDEAGVLLRDPPFLGERLTLRAVPVAARVV